MGIPAKKFEFLNRETNVAISEFTSALDGGILNSSENQLKELSSSLMGQIGNLEKQSGALLQEVSAFSAKAEGMIAQAQSTVMAKAAEAEGMVNNIVEQAQTAAGGLIEQVQGTAGELLGGTLGSIEDFASTTFSSTLGEGGGILSELSGKLNIEGLSDVTRMVKGAIGEVQNIAALPDKLLNELSETLGTGLLGFLGSDKGPVSGKAGITSDVKKLLQSCKNSGSSLGTSLPGKPYSPAISCNNGEFKVAEGGSSNGCNAGTYGDLFGKITGGEYQTTYRDLNKALKSLVGLSNLGYSAGMCGVFGVLSKNLPEGAATKAGATIAATMAAKGNTHGVLDIAKHALTSNYKAIVPGIAGSFLENFDLPFGTKKSELPTLADQSLGAIEAFDDSWNVSLVDGGLSTSFASKVTDVFKDVASSKLTNKIFTSLSTPSSSDEDFLFGSLLTA